MSASLTGYRLGLAVCGRCSQVARLRPSVAVDARCPRCDARLSMRKPRSLTRALAFLLAGYILYLPANLLPVIQTTTFRGSETDTITSGVAKLIASGSWLLGALVFFASVVVPLLKLATLTLLIGSVYWRSQQAPLQRTRLFRFVEFVGRWSMLDIYVITLLVGLVQIQSLATIEPRAGAAAFAAVVISTMFSALSFDPRLIWDPID
jgi:paraquat-inducible protein A